MWRAALVLSCVWNLNAITARADLFLDFNTPVASSLRDVNGLGTGFTHRLPLTGSALGTNDPKMDLLSSPGNLRLTATPSDIEHFYQPRNLDQLEAPGVFFQDVGSQDLSVETRILGTLIEVPSDQLGLYIGTSANSVVRVEAHTPSRFYVVAYDDDGAGPPGDVILYDSGINAFSVGDDLQLKFGRTSGMWSFEWQNLTASTMGSSGPLAIPFLNDPTDLYGGIIALRSSPSGAYTNTFDYFSAVGPTAVIPEPSSLLLVSIAACGAYGCRARPNVKWL